MMATSTAHGLSFAGENSGKRRFAVSTDFRIDADSDRTVQPQGASGRDAGPACACAVVIPANEELTIASVVREFRAALPGAPVFVCDNNSSDRRWKRRTAGADRHRGAPPGRGYAVQTLFRRVDADIYVMVDGEGTYPASAVHSLIDPVRRGEADMVIARG